MSSPVIDPSSHADVWIVATRTSHDRLADLLTGLSEDAVRGPSYDDDWTIADVASHLGSQAEIFGLFLDAGLGGATMPGFEAFGPIWDRWNTTPPAEQVRASIEANERFVRRIEGLTGDDLAAFPLPMFGRELDLPALLAMRLGEHAVHTWDVAVALDAEAVVAPDAVGLLIETLDQTAARTGKPIAGAAPIQIETTEPAGRFVLVLDPAVELIPSDATAHSGGDAPLRLTGDALIRLVFGRLDSGHTSADADAHPRIDEARAAFPGF
jgi:uncharacterized protein (TIGR03083 family)